MGWHMAAHQARLAQQTGSECLVWNRTASKAEAHAKEFGSRAVTLEQALAAELIISCLPTSHEVGLIVAQCGQHEGASYWLDCSSGHPEQARQQHSDLAQKGVTFLDAPVSGGTNGAEAGELTVMVGGESAEIETIRPLIAFAGKIVHVGPVGAGFAVKAINNALLAAQLWATGEGLSTLGRAGVNMTAALEVINASSGRSNASQNLIPQRVLTREFPVTFQLGLLAKDTRIAVDVAQSSHSSTPVLSQVSALMQAATQQVGAEEDHSAALKLVEMMNQQEITD